MRPIRSLLICTTTMERHVRSALASSADAVVLDLETTIADAEKSAARAAAVNVLAGRHRPDIFVRINEIDSRHVFDDLLALQTSNLRGVMLPQAEDAGRSPSSTGCCRNWSGDIPGRVRPSRFCRWSRPRGASRT